MGTYIPTDAPRSRSVSDTLAEAEDEHFLDCPNADFFIRAAAILLDAIFCFLITSAIRRIAGVIEGYLPPGPSYPFLALRYSAMALQVLAFYLYFLWSLSSFGGTPAKLLLGLRVLDASTGRRLGVPRILLRECLGKPLSLAPCALGFLLCLLRRDARALHDLISGTVVKRVHGES